MQLTAETAAPITESNRRCTGPRTREGKQKSSQNSTKHGCCSKRLVLPSENHEEWESLKATWLQSYDTNDPATLLLVTQAAEAQWQHIRTQNAFSEVQRHIYKEQPDCTLWTEEHHKLYARFQRYLTTAERSFYRAFQLIERLCRGQARQQEIAFNQDLHLRRLALREDRTLHEITLIDAKTELANARILKISIAETT